MDSWDYLADAGWKQHPIRGELWHRGDGIWRAAEEAVDIQLERDRTRMAFVLGYESTDAMMAAIGAKGASK